MYEGQTPINLALKNYIKNTVASYKEKNNDLHLPIVQEQKPINTAVLIDNKKKLEFLYQIKSKKHTSNHNSGYLKFMNDRLKSIHDGIFDEIFQDLYDKYSMDNFSNLDILFIQKNKIQGRTGKISQELIKNIILNIQKISLKLLNIIDERIKIHGNKFGPILEQFILLCESITKMPRKILNENKDSFSKATHFCCLLLRHCQRFLIRTCDTDNKKSENLRKYARLIRLDYLLLSPENFNFININLEKLAKETFYFFKFHDFKKPQKKTLQNKKDSNSSDHLDQFLYELKLHAKERNPYANLIKFLNESKILINKQGKKMNTSPEKKQKFNIVLYDDAKHNNSQQQYNDQI